jgi:hypothetical protein
MENKNKSANKLISLICLMIVVSPAVIFLYYIIAFGVNVPYSDTWREIPFIQQYLTGKFQFLSLFTVIGSYKIATTFLSTLWILKLFHWNIRIYALMGFCYQILTGMILYGVYWRLSNQNRNHYLRILGGFPIFLCLFTLRQWENTMGDWPNAFFGAIFFSILAFYALDKRELKWFTLAILSGLLGSMTFITGVLVWPIGLIELVFIINIKGLKEKKRSILILLVWIIFGVVSSIFYFWGTSALNSSAKNVSDLMTIAQRFFITLGSALSADKGVISLQAKWMDATVDTRVSMITGIFIFLALTIGLYFSWKAKAESFGMQLAIILFGLIAVGMTAVGRTELGLQQATASRYTTYSSFTVVGAYLAILGASISKNRPSYWARLVSNELLRVLIAIILFSSMVAIVTELQLGPYRKAFLMEWADTIRNYSTVSDDKFSLDSHFSPQQIRDYSQVLDEYHLSVFSK